LYAGVSHSFVNVVGIVVKGFWGDQTDS